MSGKRAKDRSGEVRLEGVGLVLIGGWAVLLVLLGVLVHGGIRIFLALVSGPMAERKRLSDKDGES